MKSEFYVRDDEELAPFLPLISNCKITEKAMLKFHAGQIDSVEVCRPVFRRVQSKCRHSRSAFDRCILRGYNYQFRDSGRYGART